MSTSSTCLITLAGRVFYEPSEEGLGHKIGERLQRLRRLRVEERRKRTSD